jgi:hypothetical protein
MAIVNIARIFAWWKSIKSSRLTRRNSHHTAKWLVGYVDIRSEFASSLCQFVMVQIGFWKVISQQPKARYDGIVAPPLMLYTDNIDYQGIAWFRTFYVKRASERVDIGKIQCSKHLRRRIWEDLLVGPFAGLKYDCVARLNA